MKVKESVLRDLLKDRLHMIAPDLRLVDTEFYLENRIGTAGFIDILARDSTDRLVVIEIKVSKHSEREAITELFKYLSLLKQKMSLKDSEVKLFVISTDWRELLTPFAEFHWNTAYDSTGLLAILDESGNPLELQPVDLPQRDRGREFVPRHWIQVYSKKNDRDTRGEQYAKKMVKRGIQNFVLVRFHFDYIGPRQFGFYFAQQKEGLELYKRILRSVSKDRYEEIDEFTKDMTNDKDILNEFADAAIDMVEVPADEMEIGSPEKFKAYLERGLWTIEGILRFGTLAADIRLRDEHILYELCGYGGASHTWYMAWGERNNPAQLESIRTDFDSCLYHNDYWRRTIHDYLRYFESKPAGAKLFLSIFNPENIIETIALCASRGFDAHSPRFTLVIDDPDAREIEIFEGAIVATASRPKALRTLINKYFDTEPSNVVMYDHLHLIGTMNAEIMADLGLSYGASYRRMQNGSLIAQINEPVVRGRGIAAGSSQSVVGLPEWMHRHRKLVAQIQSIYSKFRIDVLGLFG